MSSQFLKSIFFFSCLILVTSLNLTALAEDSDRAVINQPDTSENEALSLAQSIDARFGIIVENMGTVLFWTPIQAFPVPLIVLILLCGSLFFTIYHKWLNFRGFKHAIDITRGRYDNPDDPGEISHFQALTSALSATVGLGNIAGLSLIHI